VTKKLSRTFVTYTIIGLSGVTLDVVIFYALYNWVGLDKMVATFISISIAITNNFLLNTYFNFKVTDRLLGRFARFYTVGLAGIILTDAIFAIFVDRAGMNANLVKIGSLLPVLLLQYSLNKHWSFRTETVSHEAENKEA
jgi:putative flippase GtrA